MKAGLQQEDGYNAHPVPGHYGDEHGYQGYNAMLGHSMHCARISACSARPAGSAIRRSMTTLRRQLPQHQRKETWSENQSYTLGGRYQRGGYQSELQGNHGSVISTTTSIAAAEEAQDRTHIRQVQLRVGYMTGR